MCTHATHTLVFSKTYGAPPEYAKYDNHWPDVIILIDYLHLAGMAQDRNYIFTPVRPSVRPILCIF